MSLPAPTDIVQNTPAAHDSMSAARTIIVKRIGHGSRIACATTAQALPDLAARQALRADQPGKNPACIGAGKTSIIHPPPQRFAKTDRSDADSMQAANKMTANPQIILSPWGQWTAFWETGALHTTAAGLLRGKSMEKGTSVKTDKPRPEGRNLQ